MSKITREEALEYLEDIFIKPFCCDEQYTKLKEFINQPPPQLSDDVEEAVKLFTDYLNPDDEDELFGGWELHRKALRTIKSKLQAQASEIERLKQPPQLSDDVEELFKNIITAEDVTIPSPLSAGLPTDYVPITIKDCLKQETKNAILNYIQAQASVIKDLKEIIIQQSNARNKLDLQLNAIREVIGEQWCSPFPMTDRDMKIKQILGDE